MTPPTVEAVRKQRQRRLDRAAADAAHKAALETAFEAARLTLAPASVVVLNARGGEVDPASFDLWVTDPCRALPDAAEWPVSIVVRSGYFEGDFLMVGGRLALNLRPDEWVAELRKAQGVARWVDSTKAGQFGQHWAFKTVTHGSGALR